MEILLWLVPAAVVTLVAMLWVARSGRDQAPTDTSEEVLARMGRALAEDQPRGRVRPRGSDEPSGGVALRGPHAG